mgnify:CR=1 FL=1
MFNATRMAVAVTVLALVAGLSYVAVPTLERAIVPAAPAAISAEDFAGFTGTFRAVGCRDGEMTNHEWGHTIEGDYCSPMTLEVSDERLSGTARAAHNAVRFKNGAAYGVRTLTAEIVNEGGSWSGTGDYEGLTALMLLSQDDFGMHFDVEGVILPGDLPPVPEPAIEDAMAMQERLAAD